MTVGRFCTREVIVCQATDTVQEAAMLMSEHNVGSLIIVDDTQYPVGILTDRDLVIDVLAKGTDPTAKIADISFMKPVIIQEETPLEDAVKLMRKNVCRRLPVTDTNGRLIGILSTDDVIELLSEEMSDVSSIISRQANPRTSQLVV